MRARHPGPPKVKLVAQMGVPPHTWPEIMVDDQPKVILLKAIHSLYGGSRRMRPICCLHASERQEATAI